VQRLTNMKLGRTNDGYEQPEEPVLALYTALAMAARNHKVCFGVTSGEGFKGTCAPLRGGGGGGGGGLVGPILLTGNHFGEPPKKRNHATAHGSTLWLSIRRRGTDFDRARVPRESLQSVSTFSAHRSSILASHSVSYPIANLAASRVLRSNMAMVIGPTPPGTGVIHPDLSFAASYSMSPTSRYLDHDQGSHLSMSLSFMSVDKQATASLEAGGDFPSRGVLVLRTLSCPTGHQRR